MRAQVKQARLASQTGNPPGPAARAPGGAWLRFALHPDGRRVAGAFVAASPSEKSAHPEIALVTNFFDELKAKFAQRYKPAFTPDGQGVS